MLQFYHSTSPASENFPKISEEDQLRSFLLSLRKAHNGSLAPALLFSAHVLKFHESVYEVLRLSNGANGIPKFVSSKKAGVICKTFAKVTSLKDGVNVCSADGDVADFMNSSDVEMSDNILIDIPFFEIIDGSLNSKGIILSNQAILMLFFLIDLIIILLKKYKKSVFYKIYGFYFFFLQNLSRPGSNRQQQNTASFRN